MAVRLIYVDDSGSAQAGLVVYGWLACEAESWRHGLRAWLDFRKMLFAEHQIPPSVELHATKFINGRGRISTTPGFTAWKALGRTVAIQALAAIGECGAFRVGSVYRRVDRPANLGRGRAELYATLVSRWNDEAGAAGDLALVFTDGDGTDPSYRTAHRALALDTRNVIEDPLFHPAHRSQWIQMADLVAYTAYLAVAKPPGKDFGWDWYEEYLAACDVIGRPLEI